MDARRRTTLALLLALLAGCGTARSRPSAMYDFGPPNPGATQGGVHGVELTEVTAPAWLDTPAILYRLAYRNPARLLPYADSRWAAPPAALLALRLRQALAAPQTGEPAQSRLRLRVELEEFCQVFDTPQSSQAWVRARAVLLNKTGQPLAENTFTARQAAPTPDAEGAAGALRDASDELIAALVRWLAVARAQNARAG